MVKVSIALVAGLAIAGTFFLQRDAKTCQDTNARFTAASGDTFTHCDTGQRVEIVEVAKDSLLKGRVGEMQFSHRAPMVVPMRPSQCRLAYEGTTDHNEPRAILAFQCDEGSDTI